jgi:hypothetical protein
VNVDEVVDFIAFFNFDIFVDHFLSHHLLPFVNLSVDRPIASARSQTIRASRTRRKYVLVIGATGLSDRSTRT